MRRRDAMRRDVIATEGAPPRTVPLGSANLAARLVPLTGGNWALLRDPKRFSVRERRRLQHYLLGLGAGPAAELDLDHLTGLLVGGWSFAGSPPAGAEDLQGMRTPDHRLLSAAVRAELPGLQRAVQPAPGWRRRAALAQGGG